MTAIWPKADISIVTLASLAPLWPLRLNSRARVENGALLQLAGHVGIGPSPAPVRLQCALHETP